MNRNYDDELQTLPRVTEYQVTPCLTPDGFHLVAIRIVWQDLQGKREELNLSMEPKGAIAIGNNMARIGTEQLSTQH